jgi:hypothetical protein
VSTLVGTSMEKPSSARRINVELKGPRVVRMFDVSS